MRSSAAGWVLLTGFALAWLPGCGGKSGEKPPARAKEAAGEIEPAKDEIKHYDLTDLPPVDEPLPRPLDGGHLEICPPADWTFSNQANYLVVFAKGKVSELPRMTVAAVTSPHGSENTTEENAQTLAKDIQKKLVKDKRKVREKPKPVKLGDSVWVRHVREVPPHGGSPCAVQSLQIVRGGRLYTLEMFSEAKDDSQAAMATAVNAGNVRMISYAVAANARFKEAGAATPPKSEEKPPDTPAPETKTPPAAEKPAEKPAEAKPEEKKTG